MLGKILPFINWFKDYNVGKFKVDAIAGLTVALVLIPQSMAYAQLAGLPAYYGLYASLLPPMLAALFGSSRQLATGPVAVVSLMTAASLEPLATTGSEGYIAYAVVLALMVGIFQLSLGILRLGLVVNFLSHPVVNGFTNAAAIIIATSQLSKMFGVSVDTATHHYETIWRVLQEAAHYIHWPTLLMGVFAFGIMYGLKTLAPRIPNVLVAVVITTLISWATGFEHNRTVPISAIAAPRVQALVVQFNEATQGIAALAKERTEINRVLSEAMEVHDTERTINAQRDTDVVQVHMQRLKDQAQAARKGLRHIIFGAVVQKDGSLVFYPEEELPAGAETDGRRWHIRVSNAALATDGIVMKGGGSVVGSIPKGLPSFSVPKLEWGIILRLFPFAVIISLLGFM
jgi:MFS superfamily sulfate permease-like transporter